MLQRITSTPIQRRFRRGMAPLEFVMALPFLMLLMVTIVWLGFLVIGQTEVLVEARNKAWKRRFENLADKPLIFPVEVPIAGLSLYEADKDYAVDNAKQKVDVSPMFDKLPGPNANHTVLAGAWDWRAMPLNSPPNWKLLGIAAVSGTAGSIQDVLAKLNGDFIENLLEGLAKQAIADAVKKYEPLGTVFGAIGSFDDVESSNKATEKHADKAKQENQGERDAKNAEIRRQIAALDVEIAATQAEYDKLINPPQPQNPPANDQNPPQNPEPDKPTPQTDIEKINQVKFLEGKLKRLKSDRYDLTRELE